MKAVQEEFHGNGLSGADWKGKLLYGWGTLNTNVWLPSLSELVGYDSNHYDTPSGVYFSAMQEVNTATWYFVDPKGGSQFAWFQQFNANGGGTAIMNVCNQESAWLRSSNPANATNAWRTTNASNMNTSYATNTWAVHPAMFPPEQSAACGTAGWL